MRTQSIKSVWEACQVFQVHLVSFVFPYNSSGKVITLTLTKRQDFTCTIPSSDIRNFFIVYQFGATLIGLLTHL